VSTCRLYTSDAFVGNTNYKKKLLLIVIETKIEIIFRMKMEVKLKILTKNEIINNIFLNC